MIERDLRLRTPAVDDEHGIESSPVWLGADGLADFRDEVATEHGSAWVDYFCAYEVISLEGRFTAKELIELALMMIQCSKNKVPLPIFAGTTGS